MSADLNTLYTGLIIVNILVLPILLLLMVQVLRRKHRTTDIKIFFRMLVMNMLYSLAYISGFLLLFNEDRLNSTFVFAGAVICNTVLGVIPILLVAHWMVFVEFTLHQSMDIIRRRYPVIMIPFWIGIVISIFNMIAVIPRSTPLLVLQIVFVLNRFLMLIWIFYIVATYVVYYREKKRKSIPQYIRITPTALSFTLGLLISAFTSFQIEGLGYAIGLLFADYYMFRRLSYVDQETGFFTEKYLTVLGREADKKDIHNATVIHFKTSGDSRKLAEILKYWEPEHSKIVMKSDGEFLVLSEAQKKTIVQRFIFLVQEHCAKEGLQTEASYEVIRKDSAANA
jgi:hypothetical protein